MQLKVKMNNDEKEVGVRDVMGKISDQLNEIKNKVGNPTLFFVLA